jgi:hypothetical protein
MTHKYPCLIAEGKFDNPCSCIPTTHDELLKKIDWIINTKNAETQTLSTLGVAVFASLNALRAVVELHKPEHSIRGYRCTFDDEMFPCKTIQKIERELS